MIPALSDFPGEWDLCRQIEDARAGTRATFEGCASFTPASGGLEYHEEGVLHLPGQAAIRAERRYYWSLRDGRIHVAFEDGRAFHDFDPGAGQAAHWCDPDQYDVSYDFLYWPEWQARWRVRGPRKDYVMTSIYRRAGVESA